MVENLDKCVVKNGVYNITQYISVHSEIYYLFLLCYLKMFHLAHYE